MRCWFVARRRFFARLDRTAFFDRVEATEFINPASSLESATIGKDPSMSLRKLVCSTLVLAPLAVFPVGCSEEVKLKEVSPSEVVPPPKQEDRLKSETQARPNSSAGMNYDPGGTTNKKSVD